MHVVIGVWEMDPHRRELQVEGLPHIVAGVRQAPGLVQGFWADGPGSNRSHTFIVFEDEQAADAFAASVRGNAENQAMAGIRVVSLEVAEVSATT